MFSLTRIPSRCSKYSDYRPTSEPARGIVLFVRPQRTPLQGSSPSRPCCHLVWTTDELFLHVIPVWSIWNVQHYIRKLKERKQMRLIHECTTVHLLFPPHYFNFAASILRAPKMAFLARPVDFRLGGCSRTAFCPTEGARKLLQSAEMVDSSGDLGLRIQMCAVLRRYVFGIYNGVAVR